ncbi:hypothetical protein BDV18DRAFT_159475 [Aspergillus unguis]
MSHVCSAPEDAQFSMVYWKKRFDVRHPSPHPVIAILDVEYNELAKAWKRLQELLPLSDQVLFEERPQTAHDVLVLISDIQATWASSPQQHLFNRSRTLCDAFITTLESHSILLAIIPSHQFYSSLFYGALQSIIKASSRYPRVMDGVMKALAKVNRSINLPQNSDVQLSHDPIPALSRFYSHVFFLLGELMDWYARRYKCRLLHSLHEDVYLDFCNLVSRIRNSARGIMLAFDDPMENDSDCEDPGALMQHTDFYLWEDARLSQIGRRSLERRFAAQNALTRLLIWEIQRSAEQRSRLREKRGMLLLQMFNTASQRFKPVAQQNSAMVCLTAAPGQDLLIAATTSEKNKHKYSRVELQLASAHLQEYFDHNDQIPTSCDESLELVIEENVLESLKQWSADTHSQILAIGDASNTSSSPACLISSCYTTLARNTQTPIIAYSCTLPPASLAKDGITLFQQGLIALAYSLIRQLLEYLPPVVNGSPAHTVKAENFTLLDGTLASWKEVLSLIDTLLYYSPPLLMCIIDGLDRLQDASTDEYTRSLVRVFVSHTRRPSDLMPGRQSVLLKILLTVEGNLESLAETLTENPLTMAESDAIERSVPSTPLASDVEIVVDA